MKKKLQPGGRVEKQMDKYQELNLNHQILREYPLNILELPSKGDQKEEDVSTIVFDSISLLEKRVYFAVFKMFFDNDQQQAAALETAQNKMQEAMQAQVKKEGSLGPGG